MNTELMTCQREMILLTMLKNQKTDGYTLAKTVSEITGCEEKDVYPVLLALRKQKLAAASFSKGEQGRWRRWYSITQQGKLYRLSLATEIRKLYLMTTMQTLEGGHTDETK